LTWFDAATNVTLDLVGPRSNGSVSQAALMATYDAPVKFSDAGGPLPGLAIAEARAMRLDDPAREAISHRVPRLTTELLSHVALMTRPSIYAFRQGCILNLTSYLPTGSDRFNDVQVGKACK